MYVNKHSLLFFSLSSLTGLSDAFWRMSCSTVQTGRIDPVVSPGKIASHAHKIVGASNIGLDSTYDSLQTASCTSCEITKDLSTYWTPLLYYEHANGSFEEVPNGGMAIYYEGRGDITTDLKPFPPGFRMLSGDTLARSYNTSLTYKDTRPIGDRVSFACLAGSPMPESPVMNETDCENGLRAQVHFQSCWDGVNNYLPDNSHVAYMSNIDNGACPPGYPVHFIHLFYEVLYSVNSIDKDGGRFVFAQGDSTGYGFHGDFLNGWDEATLTAALSQCAAGDKNPSGVVGSCPVFAPMNDQDFATNCPARLPLIDEPVLGMIDKLPGCITITEGPASATAADMVCGTDTTQPSMSSASSESGTTVGAEVNGWKYLGCANEPTNARALDGASMIDGNLTNGVCQAWCSKKGFTMAGTEYASQCYCGNSLATGSSLGAKCKSIKCAGSDAEYCGGPDRLSVYQKSS